MGTQAPFTPERVERYARAIRRTLGYERHPKLQRRVEVGQTDLDAAFLEGSGEVEETILVRDGDERRLHLH